MDIHRNIRRESRAVKNRLLSKIFDSSTTSATLLHGMLHIKIISCSKLRNFDRVGNILNVTKFKRDKSDPYVVAFLEEYRLLKTRHIDDNLSPVFDEEFYCPVAHVTEGIMFKVKDKDVVKDETLGQYFLPIQELLRKVSDGEVEDDSELSVGDYKHVGVHKQVYLDGKKNHGVLDFFVEFIPARMLCQTIEVPGTYFREQKGNDVKLYMNADDDGSAPVITYAGENGVEEKTWMPPRLWHDLYHALTEAKHFIYAVGWSFDVDQLLLRGAELQLVANTKYSAKFGELLKQKSDEGVVVNLMQWDEPSSNFVFPGMMCTFDEKTRTFFHRTKVTSKFMGMTGGDFGVGKNLAFTHHQKFIVMDSPKKDSDERELLGFIGGIDVTKGRWDNRKHPLFRSLQSDHKGDVYTKCFHVNDENGPRQPWHDIHSRVVGPEALNLVQAFSERWMKQAGKDVGDLVNIHRLGLGDHKKLANDGGWHTQLSRSIDNRVNAFDASVRHGFKPTNVDAITADWLDKPDKDAEKSRSFEQISLKTFSFDQILDQKKGRLVDNSIHMSHIHHIRRAKHHIYIESQYFMGSSFIWCNENERDVKCSNLIAAELAIKICEKIVAHEPFAVYILLPMWMEGIPQDGATQGLLYFQRRTIEAMYKQVHKALETRMANSSDYGLHVSNYLNFYCLGTRETKDGSQATCDAITDDEKLLTQTRRHQIYVHSKMMIVDDEVCLIGTANINQRSLDGCRDSEIMMTSYQPEHLATHDSVARGDIHAFRMHIWASITDQMNDAFRNPSTKECVDLMNSIAENNFKTYMGEQAVDMTSHLLPFPLEFYHGELRPRRGLEDGKLPDTVADAMGKKSLVFPEMFLT